jgi:hypothetical protein
MRKKFIINSFPLSRFLYISLVSFLINVVLIYYLLFAFQGCMMPEMKNAMEKALHVSLAQGLEVLGLQASGVITGPALIKTKSKPDHQIQVWLACL